MPFVSDRQRRKAGAMLSRHEISRAQFRKWAGHHASGGYIEEDDNDMGEHVDSVPGDQVGGKPMHPHSGRPFNDSTAGIPNGVDKEKPALAHHGCPFCDEDHEPGHAHLKLAEGGKVTDEGVKGKRAYEPGTGEDSSQKEERELPEYRTEPLGGQREGEGTAEQRLKRAGFGPAVDEHKARGGEVGEWNTYEMDSDDATDEDIARHGDYDDQDADDHRYTRDSMSDPTYAGNRHPHFAKGGYLEHRTSKEWPETHAISHPGERTSEYYEDDRGDHHERVREPSLASMYKNEEGHERHKLHEEFEESERDGNLEEYYAKGGSVRESFLAEERRQHRNRRAQHRRREDREYRSIDPDRHGTEPTGDLEPLDEPGFYRYRPKMAEGGEAPPPLPRFRESDYGEFPPRTHHKRAQEKHGFSRADRETLAEQYLKHRVKRRHR